MSEQAGLIPLIAACTNKCGASIAIGVTSSLPDAEFLAGKVITRLGWVCTRNEKPRTWYCPRCWLHRVATIGITPEVDAAVEKAQRAYAIEVVHATGAR